MLGVRSMRSVSPGTLAVADRRREERSFIDKSAKPQLGTPARLTRGLKILVAYFKKYCETARLLIAPLLRYSVAVVSSAIRLKIITLPSGQKFELRDTSLHGAGTVRIWDVLKQFSFVLSASKGTAGLKPCIP
ncbi:jg3342 [Pararge aegeria aegeria]|uniref:Jg3342 protein n=1 Tax=Pararge aegeria aegeria TaxID=348720 RepID=A0A8S4RS97_9NEOP|nr:jg3342 [Pararge aegeria aegeria]